MREIVSDMGVTALEAHARALGTWEAFCARLAERGELDSDDGEA
jgi:hypothetical protein